MDAADVPIERIIAQVQKFWGFDALRPLQEQAIRACLQRRDSLVVLPTGGGKSLCYQVPPLLTGRLTLVVSPLIALMKDQVDGMRASGYPAAAIHSHLDTRERQRIRAGLADGSLRLLLIAPERLLSESFLPWLISIVGERGIDSFAIDEAHCISQWGHDFRPEYRRLRELRDIFPGVPLHAFTATATPRVRDDIVAQLDLHEPRVLVGRFDRPNLTYRILPRQGLESQVCEAIRRHDGRAAIVYCVTRKQTESLAASLCDQKIDARAYHAGLSPNERSDVSEAFRAERLNVVVATVAFGMGIDRGDVRCVVHAAMPKSIEHYQQETGRAGRDGLPAECLMLYSAGDMMKWKGIMELGAAENGTSPEVMRAATELLTQMQRFCTATVCRHQLLSEYFGQEYRPPGLSPPASDQNPATTGAHAREEHIAPASIGCGACDVCLHELVAVPGATDIARKIISAVARVRESFGAAHISDVLRGRTTAPVLAKGHEKLSVFGLLPEFSKERLVSYMNQLIDLGALRRAPGEFPVLMLTELSGPVLKNQHPVALFDPKVSEQKAGSAAAGNRASPLSEPEQRLFESLRVWRRSVADSRGLPPFAVLSDVSLDELARVRPSSRRTLINVYGIGDVKLKDLGEQILAHIADWCRRNNLNLDATEGTRRRSLPENRQPKKTTGNQPRAFPLFADGRSVEEVSRTLSVAHSTAHNYLANYILEHRPVSIETWVDAVTYKQAAAALPPGGPPALKTAFEKLKGSVSYDDLRLVMNHLTATGRR